MPVYVIKMNAQLSRISCNLAWRIRSYTVCTSYLQWIHIAFWDKNTTGNMYNNKGPWLNNYRVRLNMLLGFSIYDILWPYTWIQVCRANNGEQKNQWSWNYLLHIRKTCPLQGMKGQTCWSDKLNNSIMASSSKKQFSCFHLWRKVTKGLSLFTPISLSPRLWYKTGACVCSSPSLKKKTIAKPIYCIIPNLRTQLAHTVMATSYNFQSKNGNLSTWCFERIP